MNLSVGGGCLQAATDGGSRRGGGGAGEGGAVSLEENGFALGFFFGSVCIFGQLPV